MQWPFARVPLYVDAYVIYSFTAAFKICALGEEIICPQHHTIQFAVDFVLSFSFWLACAYQTMRLQMSPFRPQNAPGKRCPCDITAEEVGLANYSTRSST